MKVGMCALHFPRGNVILTVLFGFGDERATRGAINRRKNNELLS